MQSLQSKHQGLKPIDLAYETHYKEKNSDRHIYAVEWVVRVFLGSYPLLKMDQNLYPGSRILDLGFGDGRNFPLLKNLGFTISGVEIAESILDVAREKFSRLGIPVDLSLGRNSHTLFEDKSFDYLLACHALYYVDHRETFTNNLDEIARIVKPGGFLIASLPRTTGSILKGAKPLPAAGHVEITNDPLKLRNGSIFRVFESEVDIEKTFSPYFENFIIGSCDDNYFGTEQHVWILVCRRSND